MMGMVSEAMRRLGARGNPSVPPPARVNEVMTCDLTAYTANRDLLYDNLTAMGFRCVRPDGTFYLLVRSPEPDAAAFSRKAMELDLLFPDTGSFALPGCARIAYCVPTSRMERSIPRFRELAKLYGLNGNE